MALGHMLTYRGMAALLAGTGMGGHTFAFMEALDGVLGDAGIKLCFDQRVRDGVVMFEQFDVIIDMDPDFFPFGIGIGGGWQGFQSRFNRGY